MYTQSDQFCPAEYNNTQHYNLKLHKLAKTYK